MSDDPSYKTVSETIRNYIVALAVVGGGGWTVFEFASLERIERTRIERELKTTELERVRRQLLRQRLELRLTADAKVIEPGRFLILGEVVMDNVSDVRVDVPLDPEFSTLQAVHLRQLPGGETVASNRQIWRPRDHKGPIAGVTVHPGREIVIPFAFWVDTPGIYLLSFQSELSEEASTEDSALSEKFEIDRFVLGETRLLSVGLDFEVDQSVTSTSEHLQQR